MGTRKLDPLQNAKGHLNMTTVEQARGKTTPVWM